MKSTDYARSQYINSSIIAMQYGINIGINVKRWV